MAIIVTIDKGDFVARLVADKNASWSAEGAEALFDYLDEESYVLGEPIEFDLIALRCEYSEDTVDDLIDQYDIDVSDAEDDEDEKTDIVRGYLERNTTIVGETSDGFVYAVF